MTVLGALASRDLANAIQSTPWGDWSDTGSYSGPAVSNSTALQLLTVYGCNRFICDGISTLPVDVLRRQSDGSPKTLNTPRVIATPTADLDFASWATQVLTSLLMAGNFYGLRVYVGTVLEQVIPLDPEKVTVRREGGRKVFDVGGKIFTKYEIMHIPGVMWPGSDVGMSPLEAARQTIGQGISAQEFGLRFYGQDGSMPGVIEVPTEMTPEKTKQLAAAWARARRKAGDTKLKLPGVLEGGATWKPTGVSNEQSQFLETRKFTASEIASQMFQIDPAEMGLPVDGSSLTYANLEQRNARKVQVTFLPWITRLEAALTSMLPRPQYVKLNVNALLRGDTKTRFDAYAVGINSRFMVPNEARDFEDWPALEGGDEFAPAPAPAMAPAPQAAIDRTPVFNVGLPDIHVNVPDSPDVHVDVHPPDAPPVHVHVPDAPAPVVNVLAETPTVEITVPVPEVHIVNDVQPSAVVVVDKPKVRTVVRDNQGNIAKIVED